MNATQIYLIRHGESEGNKLNLFLGHTDLDITEKGQAQAKKTAEYLTNIPVDVIYSSDLKRAYNTALPTAKIKGMEIIKSKNLREIYAGKWENRLFDDLAVDYEVDYRTWKENIGLARCTDGESVAELQKRFLTELKRIAEENAGKSIFIFAHATPIRVTKAALDGVPLDEIKNIPWPSNASVTHIECRDGELRMIEYDKCDFMGDLVTALPKTV